MRPGYGVVTPEEIAALGRILTVLRAGAMPPVSALRLAAVALTETRAGLGEGYQPAGDPLGWGDSGHAFGFWQIDRRYHKAFLATPASRTVQGQVRYVAGLLGAARATLASHRCPPHLLDRAMHSAYNAGVFSVLGALAKGQDPDEPTTGHDYGWRVLADEAGLTLAAPHMFDP